MGHRDIFQVDDEVCGAIAMLGFLDIRCAVIKASTEMFPSRGRSP